MNYTTSKDYEELWRLVQEGKEIVCFSRHLSAYVAIARKNGKYSEIFSRGIADVSARTKTSFISQCENVNVEFLPPTEWIKIESDKDLPPVGQKTLFIDSNGTYFLSWISDIVYDNEYIYSSATHWMPLPEAPEVGE